MLLYYGDARDFSCPHCKAVFRAKGPKWRLVRRRHSTHGHRLLGSTQSCKRRIAPAHCTPPRQPRPCSTDSSICSRGPARFPPFPDRPSASRCCPSGRSTGAATPASCSPTTTWWRVLQGQRGSKRPGAEGIERSWPQEEAAGRHEGRVPRAFGQQCSTLANTAPPPSPTHAHTHADGHVHCERRVWRAAGVPPAHGAALHLPRRLVPHPLRAAVQGPCQRAALHE